MREIVVCENPRIVMIHGDCMEYMAGLQPKAFELAIVDPPYGIGVNMNAGRKRDTRAPKRAQKDWDNAPPHESYFQDLMIFSTNQIIWGANNFKLPPQTGWIFWDKCVPENVSFSDGELAWTSFGGALKKITLCHSGFNGTEGSRFHPTQKPVKLYKWLLKNYAKSGDRILDTHGGSFSSAIACYQMGFDFVGIEKDVEYFEKALRRVEVAVSQGHFLTEE